MERRALKPTEHILHVVYSCSKSTSTGWNPQWSITVFAVPGNLRHSVRTQLLGQAIPDIVRPWLMQHGEVWGRPGNLGLSILLDVTEGTLRHEISEKLQPELL